MAVLGPIALGEALRRVGEQQGTLASIRGAAGTILSAATFGSAFLAGVALDDGADVTAVAWCALGATAVTAVLAIASLMPISLGVATSPELLDRDEWRAHTDDDAALYLAKYIWEHTEKAAKRLDARWNWIIAAGASTTVAIILWIVAVAVATRTPTVVSP